MLYGDERSWHLEGFNLDMGKSSTIPRRALDEIVLDNAEITNAIYIYFLIESYYLIILILSYYKDS